DDDNPGLGTSSGEEMLYSIIVDLDGDGAAELVVSSNGSHSFTTGLFVYQDPHKRWMPTRQVWNQWAYSVTNVNPDLSVPSPATPNWQEPGLNNYGVNALPVAERVGAVLVDSFREMDIDGISRSWRVNRGTVVAGDLTGDDRSELIAIGQRGSGIQNTQYLTALSFTEGNELEVLWYWNGWLSAFELNDPDRDFAMREARDPVIGDVTGDGVPEVVVTAYCLGDILIFSNTGERLISTQVGRVPQSSETSPDCPQYYGSGSTADRGRLSLVDLTGDGLPEILLSFRNRLRAFDGSGTLLWESEAPNYQPGGSEFDYAVADVNLDGRPNIWFGGTLFDADGNVLWGKATNPLSNDWIGWYAVANLNDDPFGELIYWGNGPDLVVFDHQGNCLWQARKWSNANPTPTLGCPTAIQVPDLPTSSPGFRAGLIVADIAGDGKPRIVIGNRTNSDGPERNRVIAFNADGTPFWSVPALLSSGASVRVNQINAFDLTGNGVMEIIITGVNGTVVLNGRNGQTLFEIPADDDNPGLGTSTGQDIIYSIIVDLDGDGAAELVVSSQGSAGLDGQTPTGLFVYRDPQNRWMPARQVWNQWVYSVTNINPDLSIPSVPERNWLTPGLNNYRVNAFMPGEGGAVDAFSYRVSDGELASNEATVYLDIRRPNRPPAFITSPVKRAGVGLDYRYRVRAVDPDPGDEASIRLDRGPVGMVLDANGVLRWQPGAADLGEHPVILSAIDLEGEITLQEFSLSVLEPVEVPDVLGLAQAAAEAALGSAGLAPGRLDTAYDPVLAAGLVLSQAPDGGGMVLPGDAVDLVISLGPSPVAPNFPPDRPVEAIFIEPGELILLQGQSLQLEAFALLDDGSEHRLADAAWSASGSVQVNAQGRVTATAAGAGTVNAQFQGFSAQIEVTVIGRIPGDDEAPAALLISPADGAQLTERVAVIGTAFDANLVSYRLEIGPPGGGRWETLAEGVAPVVEDVLGYLDATLMDNGLWRLRLTVLDAGGNQSVDEISVVLDGDLKAGLFSLRFVDLDLPLAGVPIRIEREYDSRRRQPGEFGPGWRLAVRSTELRCTAPLGAGWQVARSGLSFLLLPDEEKLCTVRLADGRLERFDFRPAVTSSPFVPFSLLGSSFVARPGTRGRLQPLSNTNLLIADPQPGEVVLLDDVSLNP
ncbi:MAG: PASTA domain-containing protein, partial [Wenzhouxiangella sp.]